MLPRPQTRSIGRATPYRSCAGRRRRRTTGGLHWSSGVGAAAARSPRWQVQAVYRSRLGHARRASESRLLMACGTALGRPALASPGRRLMPCGTACRERHRSGLVREALEAILRRGRTRHYAGGRARPPPVRTSARGMAVPCGAERCSSLDSTRRSGIGRSGGRTSLLGSRMRLPVSTRSPRWN